MKQKKETEIETHVPKRRKRRERVQETKQISMLQVFTTSSLVNEIERKIYFFFVHSNSGLFLIVGYKCLYQKLISHLQRFFMIVVVLVVLVAVAYYGHKGLMLLNDWMNKVEERREKTRYKRI